MAERTRGGGFGWFIVGLLAGVALTLGGLAFFNIHSERERFRDRGEDASTTDGADAASDESAKTPKRHAVMSAEAPPPVIPPAAPAPAPAVDKKAARAAAAQAADDAQMQEDEAAAGNTSRAKPPQ